MQIVFRRFCKTLLERLVELGTLSAGYIGHPLGNSQDLANTRITHCGRCTQSIAIEGVKLAFIAYIFGGLHQEAQVIPPITSDHSLGTGRFDFGGIRQKIFDSAHGVQFITCYLNVWPKFFKLQFGFSQDRLAKAVILPNQIHRLQFCILLQHLHQGCHAHVCVRIKSEMPKIAFFLCERRIDSGVV